MRSLFYIFVLCFCCNDHCVGKTLNLENLFKRNKNVYSVKGGESPEESRKKALQAKEEALQAKKEFLITQKEFESSRITIIEVNLNWNYITFYYITLLGVCIYGIYIEKKNE